MSQTYEIALRSNFERMQMLEKLLQGRWLKIYYQERGNNGPFKSVLSPKSASYYPNVFKVQYTMPMYVDTGGDTPALDRNWSQVLIFTLSEDAILGNASIGVEIDGGAFPSGKKPFNKHVDNGWICCGNFWAVSREQGGLWYFAQIVGALLNLDAKWMDTEGGHLNPQAALWWRNSRRYKPTNDIKWAFNLLSHAVAEHEHRPKLTILPLSVPKTRFSIK